jgi:predicted CXXCH cytochrome family protein
VKKFITLGLILISMLVLLKAQTAMAVVPDYYANPHYVITNRNDMCNTCHQMNTDGSVKPTTYIQTTIYGTCYTCHNGTKSNYKVDGSMDNATGTPGFAATSSIHKVKNETYFQPVLDSTFPSMKLTCVSCHSAHGNKDSNGNPEFRYLKSTLPNGTTNLNVYATVTKPADYATGKDIVVYGSGLDNWCAGCHDKNLHFDNNYGVIRHQSDWPMSSDVAQIYNSYTTVPGATDWHAAAKVPLGVGVVTDTNGNVTGMGNEQKVICMSCHQGHGSNLEKNLVRDKRARICMQCHLNQNQQIK